MTSQPLFNYLLTYRKRSALSQEEVAYLLGAQSGAKVCRYERLQNTFTLHVQNPVKEQIIKFIPSARSLYSLEVFFASRFDLFRFGVYHHRVRKFDGLLKEVILQIGREYLIEDLPEEPFPSGENDLLPENISGLWKIVSETCLGLPWKCLDPIYSQWDDAWLLNLLRKEYFKGDKDSVLHQRLDELLSNRKRYFPLFKRGECFAEIDQAFLKAGGKQLVRKLKAILKHDVSAGVVAKELQSFIGSGTIEPSSQGTFFLTTLIRYYSFPPRPTILRFISKAIEVFRSVANLEDVLLTEKLLTSGITDKIQVLTSDGAQPLSAVSNIKKALEADAKLFPPFFVFVLPKKGEAIDEKKLRAQLGEILYETFSKQLQMRPRATNQVALQTNKPHKTRNSKKQR